MEPFSVSKAGIRKSIDKIFYNEQRYYLREHLVILKNLNLLIISMIIVNQGMEINNRKKHNSWNYCVNGKHLFYEYNSTIIYLLCQFMCAIIYVLLAVKGIVVVIIHILES